MTRLHQAATGLPSTRDGSAQNLAAPPEPRNASSVRSLAMRYGLPFLLFSVSLVTTTAIGARYMQNFQDGLPALASEADLWPWPWLMANPSRFLLGWPFSAALLGILFSHEMGHYIACRVHRIRATLPWVMPAPTLSGTLGAVIRIQSRIPDRNALMDVGFYGPLVGYLASLIAIAVGFSLSRPTPPDHLDPLIQFGQPLSLEMVRAAIVQLGQSPPRFASAVPHPVLIAGWIGLFVTSLNLIPGGQLDGGHILYAVSPRLHRALRFVVPLALVFCGIFFWIGWIFWGAMLMLPGMRHPVIYSDRPIGLKRKLLALAALAIFLLTFSVEPFAGNSVLHYLHEAW